MRLPATDPLARQLTLAIREGRYADLAAHLSRSPELAKAIILERSPACGSHEYSGRSLLHVATDWPGHFPNVGATISFLVAQGADVNAPFLGKHQETPLHWAASSNDLEALDALIACGANLEAHGGVIGGGTPLADATAFGQWQAARRLVERGAIPSLWDAAALGMLERVRSLIEVAPRPSPYEITSAFWAACHGGQLAVAEYLLQQGAELNWIGYDHLTPLDAAKRSAAASVVPWLERLGAKTTAELQP